MDATIVEQRPWPEWIAATRHRALDWSDGGGVSWQIMNGHVTDMLRKLREASVHCAVTSPPYYGLRDYGLPPQVWGGDPSCDHEWGAPGTRHKGGPHGAGVMLEGGRAVVEAQAATKDIVTGQRCQCGAWLGALGLEPTPDLYVEHVVSIFRELRPALRADGTVWLNLGDCFATGAGRVGEHRGGGSKENVGGVAARVPVH